MSTIYRCEKILKEAPGVFNRRHYLIEREATTGYPAGAGVITVPHCFAVITLTANGGRYGRAYRDYADALAHFTGVTTPIEAITA